MALPWLPHHNGYGVRHQVGPSPSRQAAHARVISHRLCRVKGDADDRSQPGLQALHALWHDQHCRHGRLFSVRLARVSAVRVLTRRRL
jgi:hypothetical protein